MANILLKYLQDFDKRDNLVKSYSHSTHQALLNLGHTVTAVGEGHGPIDLKRDLAAADLSKYDLFLDVDSGRNKAGELDFQTEKLPILSAVRFVDTHGHPSLHKRLADNYDHVFFAVWSKRDIFTGHPSVHWCPHASDAKWFDKNVLPSEEETRPFDVGFFGSKHVRQLGKSALRWPHTAEAMAQCRVLFNRGQKHDGPNQRVIESMLMDRPLVTDRDPVDGMSKLFEEGEHYLGYSNDAELANQVDWCLREPSLASAMARRAYVVAVGEHQVKHRVAQILEVSGCQVKSRF